ncbi:MAG: hypothetical protein IPG63_18810 [Xanthomonadales bacterium]|nr:hypothetical protein [Xanthomonadales bacterium]
MRHLVQANRNAHQARLAALIGLAFVGPALAIGDGPVLSTHLDQSRIEHGQVDFQEVFDHGHGLFVAKFNTHDGQSRPATTGGGAARVPGSAPRFIRTSAPDANSCAGCHNDPFVGAAGDIVANVFVLAQTLDPVTESVSPNQSNERNTLGMQGSGAIEMLAREMTVEIQAQRSSAIALAAQTGQNVTRALASKNVRFGSLVAKPDGSVDTTGVAGVNADLIIRPFHQKGAVISLREFTNNAMNHHHGMQSEERFGPARTGSNDFDQDGVASELSVGDITAATIYQAALATPGQVLPDDVPSLRAIIRGEQTFSGVGCSGCHVPEMQLDSRYFDEPNPFNPSGNLAPGDVTGIFRFDLSSEGELPRLEATPDGGAIVRAYTDLKRHNLCDAEIRHFCNELVVQGGIPTESFLTRKLWDVGNSAPYGHRGDLTTITEAILAHGGEGRAARNAFAALARPRQDEVVEFLKSLQMLPPGTPALIVDKRMQPVDKALVRDRDRPSR